MLGGGPASQYPRSVIEQIRERLPRVVSRVSLRYPQKLRLLACFWREAFALHVRIASHDRRSGRRNASHRGDSKVNIAPEDDHVRRRASPSAFHNHTADLVSKVRLR